jgi:hypothetical protein
MALKKRERKPDNIQNSKQMTLSTKFNFKFTTLPIFIKKEKQHLTQHLFNKINEERKFEERRNSTI